MRAINNNGGIIDELFVIKVVGQVPGSGVYGAFTGRPGNIRTALLNVFVVVKQQQIHSCFVYYYGLDKPPSLHQKALCVRYVASRLKSARRPTNERT